MSFTVNVKWGKETYNNIDLRTTEPPIVFKAQLFELTGVPIERQKVMIPKCGALKDEDWGTNVSKLKNGITIMLVGTAEENTAKPSEKVAPSKEECKVELPEIKLLPSGIYNLGNTCYMNSCVQFIGTVPELRSQLGKFAAPSSNQDSHAKLVGSMRALYAALESGKGQPVNPILFIPVLRECFPQFAEASSHGGAMQQDAEECYSAFIRSLGTLKPIEEKNGGKNKNLIEQLFGGKLAVTIKNAEKPDEPSQEEVQPFTILQLNIDIKTNFIFDAVSNYLQGQIEKFSPSLGRTCLYNKEAKISQLPRYLSIQFVRFWWNEKSQTKAKIARPVEFPQRLDMFLHCSEALKSKLKVKREMMKEFQDYEIELKRAAVAGTALEPSKQEEKNEKNETTPADQNQIWENDTGFYDLQAVITHKGRSADSGHYVAWTRNKEKNEWYCFDDDTVTVVPSEEIGKLAGKGGADWHIAYLCLYGSVDFEPNAGFLRYLTQKRETKPAKDPMDTS